ncbi:glutathione s-transferase omega-1 [Plakobranchus ocellatus]|uniref:Glutathione S-transferase omega n=1 Tax=Plakobranchus ocellatus TaxID=259542 RepID=A0AAV3XZL3_9GAST|nr:glutathione s-transferase omega-1 [Plakobranchus ocellatus]
MSLKAHAQGSTCPPTKPGVLRLYSMRFCPFAHRTRLVLHHKNIPHEVVNVNLKDKPDWFLALNPLGNAPVLQIDDKIVVESTATSEWLDDVYPENRLQPSDPYRRAWDRVLLEYMGKLTNGFYSAAGSPAAELQGKLDEIMKHFQFFEDKLRERGEGPFFGGSKPCMFDFFFWPTFERYPALAILQDSPAARLDPQRFPKLTALGKAMERLPAVKAAGLDAEKHSVFIKGYLAGKPDYDLFLEE